MTGVSSPLAPKPIIMNNSFELLLLRLAEETARQGNRQMGTPGHLLGAGLWPITVEDTRRRPSWGIPQMERSRGRDGVVFSWASASALQGFGVFGRNSY